MSDNKWYYNVETGEVHQGKQHGWGDRMGPYDTEAQARSALDIAAQQTAEADRQDEADEDWGTPPAWQK